MAQRNDPDTGVKLVYRRSCTLTKVVVLAAVVLSMAALLTLGLAIRQNKNAVEQLRGQAVVLEQENSRLQQYIQELGTVKGIIRIAQEKLGLIEPDSVVFNPEK